MGTENTIAKFGPGGVTVINSRARDPGIGAVVIDTFMEVNEGISIREATGLPVRSTITGGGVGAEWHLAFRILPDDANPRGATLTLQRSGDQVTLDLDCDDLTADVSYAIGGVAGYTGDVPPGATLHVEGGLVMGFTP